MMGRRFVGTLMVGGIAVYLFEVAGRLASEERSGWGWFLLTGLIVLASAVSLWTGETPGSQNSTGKANTAQDGWDR
jgi:hypothetical protein